MNIVFRFRGSASLWLLAWAIPFAALIPPAQAVETSPTLKQAFKAAWARQPEARAARARRDAVGARRQTADSWLAEPPSLDVSYKTDQLNRDQGSREYEAGLAMPLWLPGERAGQRALAEVEGAALEGQLEAVRLRTAGEVREAWWSLALARIDLEAAEARRQNAERLAADVARRVKAGALSRADGHQADAAVAGAVAEVARSRGALADYVIKFTAPGDNETPINSKGQVTRNQWIDYAECVWTDIHETDTLNIRGTKGDDDTRHICPLQLPLIDRLIRLYSNPGEIVFSPFTGIGSEGVKAIENGRRFYGCEIKSEYLDAARRNIGGASLRATEEEKRDLFATVGAA